MFWVMVEIKFGLHHLIFNWFSVLLIIHGYSKNCNSIQVSQIASRQENLVLIFWSVGIMLITIRYFYPWNIIKISVGIVSLRIIYFSLILTWKVILEFMSHFSLLPSWDTSTEGSCKLYINICCVLGNAILASHRALESACLLNIWVCAKYYPRHTKDANS